MQSLKKSGMVLAFLFLVFTSFSQVNEVPDFSLTRMDNGSAFSKGNMSKGKKSLFVFFDPGCDHCQEAMKTYEASHAKLDKISIYLVTRENKDVAAKFLTTYAPVIGKKKNMILLMDRNNNFISRFLPKKFPSMYLFGKDNKLIQYSDEVKDTRAIIEKASKN